MVSAVKKLNHLDTLTGLPSCFLMPETSSSAWRMIVASYARRALAEKARSQATRRRLSCVGLSRQSCSDWWGRPMSYHMDFVQRDLAPWISSIDAGSAIVISFGPGRVSEGTGGLR